MNTTSHTPGPWKIADDNDNRPTGCICSAVCDTQIIAAGRVNGYTIAEGMANARLIAAAPELLDACEKAGSVSEGFITTATVNQLRTQLRIVQQAAKAAITKATQPEGGR